jgi:hypothetical protein
VIQRCEKREATTQGTVPQSSPEPRFPISRCSDHALTRLQASIRSCTLWMQTSCSGCFALQQCSWKPCGQQERRQGHPMARAAPSTFNRPTG